jgi:hypothetical protein
MLGSISVFNNALFVGENLYLLGLTSHWLGLAPK